MKVLASGFLLKLEGACFCEKCWLKVRSKHNYIRTISPTAVQEDSVKMLAHPPEWRLENAAFREKGAERESMKASLKRKLTEYKDKASVSGQWALAGELLLTKIRYQCHMKQKEDKDYSMDMETSVMGVAC